jgi:AmmeMemoRadiSam system protein A
MMPDTLSLENRKTLLNIARQAITRTANGDPVPPLDLSALPAPLREEGVVFVTLTQKHALRGCVGALEAYQPLAEDVQEHAIAAATADFRFYPVQPDEVESLHIEISRLSTPVPLDYASPDELALKIKPGIDGVMIRDGLRRATFLPQVWETLPDPCDFLNHLCQKMGAPVNLWQRKMLQVSTYRVEMFEEEVN